MQALYFARQFRNIKSICNLLLESRSSYELQCAAIMRRLYGFGESSLTHNMVNM